MLTRLINGKLIKAAPNVFSSAQTILPLNFTDEEIKLLAQAFPQSKFINKSVSEAVDLILVNLAFTPEKFLPEIINKIKKLLKKDGLCIIGVFDHASKPMLLEIATPIIIDTQILQLLTQDKEMEFQLLKLPMIRLDKDIILCDLIIFGVSQLKIPMLRAMRWFPVEATDAIPVTTKVELQEADKVEVPENIFENTLEEMLEGMEENELTELNEEEVSEKNELEEKVEAKELPEKEEMNFEENKLEEDKDLLESREVLENKESNQEHNEIKEEIIEEKEPVEKFEDQDEVEEELDEQEEMEESEELEEEFDENRNERNVEVTQANHPEHALLHQEIENHKATLNAHHEKMHAHLQTTSQLLTEIDSPHLTPADIKQKRAQLQQNIKTHQELLSQYHTLRDEHQELLNKFIGSQEHTLLEKEDKTNYHQLVEQHQKELQKHEENLQEHLRYLHQLKM